MRERSSFKTVAMLNGSFIRAFAEHLSGRVILPDDSAYEVARWTWKRAVDRHPGMVVRCAGVEDVARAVNCASANDLLVAVRGGGHSFAGHSTCECGMVIDHLGDEASPDRLYQPNSSRTGWPESR
jgi:FAD/FMN-containing dehydrogenase